jgi:hypothetical protein
LVVSTAASWLALGVRNGPLAAASRADGSVRDGLQLFGHDDALFA